MNDIQAQIHEGSQSNDETPQVNITQSQSAQSKTKDQLLGLLFVGAGAAILYFLGTSNVGLAAGVSCFTLGLMMVSGKLGKKE